MVKNGQRGSEDIWEQHVLTVPHLLVKVSNMHKYSVFSIHYAYLNFWYMERTPKTECLMHYMRNYIVISPSG